MELIIDGYNVMHGVPEWRSMGKQSLAEARSTIERRLALYRAKHPNVNILLYWDGDRDVTRSRPSRVHGISVIFTQSSADSAIIGRVQASKNSKEMTVATDDRALAESVKGAGANVIPVEQLAKR